MKQMPHLNAWIIPMCVRTPITVAVAVLFAALVPVIVTLIEVWPWGTPWRSLTLAFTYVFAVALAHAMLLGLPLFLLANRKGWVNVYSCVFAGFVVGCVPFAILLWPSSGADFASIDGVAVTVDGVTTLAGWLRYLEAVGRFGLLGAAGGIGFWLALRWGTASPDNRGSNNLRGGPLPKGFNTSTVLYRTFAVSVMAMSVGVISLPAITKDRSCHNMFRDGRDSIKPMAVVDLEIPDTEWPLLSASLERFAANHGLSFRDESVVRGNAVHMNFLSLCTESGVTFKASRRNFRNLKGKGQRIDIYRVQEDAEWQSRPEN